MLGVETLLDVMFVFRRFEGGRFQNGTSDRGNIGLGILG